MSALATSMPRSRRSTPPAKPLAIGHSLPALARRRSHRRPRSRRQRRDLQAQPAQSVTSSSARRSPREAAWLYKGGWPLYALVDKYATSAPLDEQTNCLATAVYFEARGESVEGQLAVARVVMNRAASGRYPPDWCSVVKQPAQFSFVRHGEFP